LIDYIADDDTIIERENPDHLHMRPAESLHVDVPTTLYDQQGRVVCVLYPDGHLLVPDGTRVGQPVQFRDGDDIYEGTIGWDGAFVREGGQSKGLLLGDYESNEAVGNLEHRAGLGRLQRESEE